MVDSIIIFGGHIQALGLARQSKSKGLSVSLVLNNNYSVARFSNTVDSVFICHNDIELKSELARHESNHTMLLPTSDDYIMFILNNYEWLNSSFYLAIPDKTTATVFADKRLTYLFAEKNDISHPKSWYLSSEDDISIIAPKVKYPVILKPSFMYSFHKLFGKKAFLCEDYTALLSTAFRIQKRFPINQLIIQEFLSGGPKCLYSYGVLAKDGEPLASIIANRIRQNPMDFGNSTTFAVSCENKEIETIAKKILKLTHYTGMAEIEFMWDKGEYKFLEVNTRAWKWHTISLGRSFGFLSSWIDYLNHSSGIQPQTNELVTWQERLTDWYVMIKECVRGRMSIKDLSKRQPGKRVFAVWSPKDPIPAIMYVILSPILFFKRH